MGQVIAFRPYPKRDPDRAADVAESILLGASRSYVEVSCIGDDPIPRLRQELVAVGLDDAAFPIDAFMAVVARAARRPLRIYCPGCPDVSQDEKQLLHAASLVQSGSCRLAEKVLRMTLLSAEGAAFAIGPLEGLGELFRRAGLFLTQRARPVHDLEPLVHERRSGDRAEPPAPHGLH